MKFKAVYLRHLRFVVNKSEKINKKKKKENNEKKFCFK